MTSILAGTIIDERYRLERFLKKGGFAEVYQARMVEGGRNVPVAIKILREDLYWRDRKKMEVFLKEIEVLKGLTHPNLVSVLDDGFFEGRPFIVLEFLEGETLADRIRAKGRLPYPAALKIALQIAEALQHIHEKGLIHRDVNPQNIMLLDEEEKVKLLDFGIAMHGDEKPDFAGTLHYIAPEQARITSCPMDERVDIYGLGVTFYESLTGEKPFSAESTEELLDLHMRGHIPLPSHKPFGIPQSVDIVIRKCLRKSPQERYRTAGEVRDDLLVLLNGGHLVERFL